MTPAALIEAAEARRTAETEYRSAVLTAVREHGASATAKILGISRQAVSQLVKRSEDLDARYAAIVNNYAASYTLSTAKAITADRNKQAKKRRKRGLAPLPTVKAEAFATAENEILQRLEAGETIDGFTFTDLTNLRGTVCDVAIPF